MSSPGDQGFATQFVARLSHDLANVLLPLRAVADLPSELRETPESIAQLWVAVDEAVTQLTHMGEQLRAITSGGDGWSQAPESHDVDAESRDSKDFKDSKRSTLPQCHVLVVEDQEIVRRAIVYLLQEAGQVCDVAENAQAAAERLQLESFDLVLLDRNLPDMKAEQLAVQIHDRKPNIPLVLVTGDDVGGGKQGIRWTNGEGHFMAMIAKPVTLKQVRWLLSEIAEAKKQDEGDNEPNPT